MLDTSDLFCYRLTVSATFSEKLLLGQGLCVSPLKAGEGDGVLAPKSLAEVVRQIDNQKDLHDYILSHEGNPGAVTAPEVQYQRHPVSCTDLLNAIVQLLTPMDRHSAEPLLHRLKQAPRPNANLFFPNRSLP